MARQCLGFVPEETSGGDFTEAEGEVAVAFCREVGSFCATWVDVWEGVGAEGTEGLLLCVYCDFAVKINYFVFRRKIRRLKLWWKQRGRSPTSSHCLQINLMSY
jgi:hypothetical protein